jgi:hypothetical protein
MMFSIDSKPHGVYYLDMKTATKKQRTKVEWTNENEARYSELLNLLINCDEPSNHFDEQVELVSLRDKAISLGMLVDSLPW